MRYASVCSGIEAASLAWEPLGWEPAWFAQFDPEHNYKNGPDFPSAVLAHRWPHVPNLGDMTKLNRHEVYQNEKLDLLVGGTPCQDDSIAGLRKGMDGKRGIIKDDFVRILAEKQPRWFVWENVPGVLSSNGGRNFAAFIGNIQAVGYSFAWRIIDAQYCGVPQRRRRVFIVGHLGDNWRAPAAVLFESQADTGISAPVRKANARGERFFSLGCRAIDRIVVETLSARDYKDPQVMIAPEFARRITEVEGERLQGMPDHHTNIIWKGKPAPSGQRYKAIGNSMATVVMHWLGKRIDYVDGLLND